jgi:hypothetical protein
MNTKFRKLLASQNDSRRAISLNPEFDLVSFSFTRPRYVEEFSLIQAEPSTRKRVYKDWNSVSHYHFSSEHKRLQFDTPVLIPNIDSRLPTDHVMFRDLLVPYNNSTEIDKWGSGIATSGWFNKSLPEFYSATGLGDLVIDPPEGLDDLIVQSLRLMLPHVRAELSLINSLIELKDFVTLKHSINGIRKFFKGFYTQSKSASLRQLTQSTADGYLQAKFNFIPLWSDIRGVHSALKKFMRRIGVHIASEGRPLVSHFKRELHEFVDPEIEDSSFNYPMYLLANLSDGRDAAGGSRVRFSRSVEYQPSLFHAQVQYNANYSAFQLEHARGLVLLDQLGVNLNPAIIWNAIPWSFVVDWFFKVGEFLNRLAIGNMEPQINIMQYSWTIKRRRKIVVSAYAETIPSYPSSPNNGTAYFTYPAVTEVAYRRQVGLPSASSFLTSGLSLTEFSLGAALVISRRRSPKRRSSVPKGPKRS